MGGWQRALGVSLLMARVVAPASSHAGENPRFSVPRPPTEAEQTPALEVWLSRLAGRFEYEGMANPYGSLPEEPRPVSGRSDCMTVGNGPGVQCVLDVRWRDRRDVMGNVVPPYPNLNPSMMLFGYEPGTAQLRFLQVDNMGIAAGGTGVLTGNTAKLTTGPPRTGSVGVSRIYAPAHGRFIQIWVSSRSLTQGEGPSFLVFNLRRAKSHETGGQPGSAPARSDTGR